MKKKTPIKPSYLYDTPEGIDRFTKIIYEDSETMSNEDYQNYKRQAKIAQLKQEYDTLKPFRGDDPTTYPSDPEQRKKLFNISQLEKSLGVKGDNFKKFVKTGAMPHNNKKKPDLWEDVVYASMTPIEKGQFNAQQRKKRTLRNTIVYDGSKQDDGPYTVSGPNGDITSEKALRETIKAEQVGPFEKALNNVQQNSQSTAFKNTPGVDLGKTNSFISRGINQGKPEVKPEVKLSVRQEVDQRVRAKKDKYLRSIGKPGGILNMDLIDTFNFKVNNDK